MPSGTFGLLCPWAPACTAVSPLCLRAFQGFKLHKNLPEAFPEYPEITNKPVSQGVLMFFAEFYSFLSLMFLMLFFDMFRFLLDVPDMFVVPV